MTVHIEFRGQEEEWKKAGALLDDVHAGEGRLLLVEGGPGTGKTTLLAALARRAADRDFTVLRQYATGPERGPAQPDGLLAQVEARVAEQASFGPVVVTLDDAHIAGPGWQSVLDNLPYLIRRYPMLWAMTRRPDQGGAALERLFRAGGRCAAPVVLGPLDRQTVDNLTVTMLGAPADRALRELIAAAAGEPQLTVELLRGLREDGSVIITGDRAALVGTELPRRVLTVVHDRLRPLSAKARQTLQVAAAFGAAFAVHDVARMLREPTATLLPTLEELLAAGLLTCEGERLAFAHGLIFRAVRETVPSSVDRALRHEARLMLAADPDRPARREPSPGRPAAPPAVDLLLALALSESSEDLELITHGDPQLPEGQRAVLTAAATAARLWNSGSLQESMAHAAVAVAACGPGTPVALRLHARLVLARKLIHRHDVAAAVALLDHAGECPADSDSIEPAAGPAERHTHAAALAVARAELYLYAGRLHEAGDEARAALKHATAGGARPLAASALARLAAIAVRAGDLSAAAEYVRRCRAEPPTAAALCSTWCDWLELLLVAEQDGPRAALDHLYRHCPDLPERRELFVREPGAAAWLTRTAGAAGEPDLAKAVVRTAECLAARNLDFAALPSAVQHARGLLNADAEALAEAAAGHREPWAAACAAEDLGLQLLQDGGSGPNTALAALGMARDRFTAIGARRDATRPGWPTGYERSAHRRSGRKCPRSRPAGKASTTWNAPLPCSSTEV